ncbi:hypothetical protein EDM00_10570 [Ornithobacterium rhinotracheale]|uniref:hypothetical protein n=1 Tax=Ornithobacterium rhinotracheale TaxID=28251 RepID=UPI00129CD61D|nr:hypothetical protein [Ornithobacterium rhinotracheale]MRI64424.1 hypothetical protein [Ornithobacterium rhinotracheale]
MKKLLSLISLIEISKALFEKNKELQTLYATEDGQFFEDENRAKLHAQNKKIKIHTLLRAVALSTVVAEKKMPANKQENTEENAEDKETPQENAEENAEDKEAPQENAEENADKAPAQKNKKRK